MKNIILISALVAVAYCKPATKPANEESNSGVPGVFISVDTLNDLKNRARQNDAQTNQGSPIDQPYSSNAAPQTQQASTQVLINQPPNQNQQLMTNQQALTNQQLVNRQNPQLIVRPQQLTSNQQPLMISAQSNQLPFVVQQPNSNQYVLSNQGQPIVLGQSSGQTTYAIPINMQQSQAFQQQQPTIISGLGQQSILSGTVPNGQGGNTLYAVVPINSGQNNLQQNTGSMLVPVQQPGQQILTVSG